MFIHGKVEPEFRTAGRLFRLLCSQIVRMSDKLCSVRANVVTLKDGGQNYDVYGCPPVHLHTSVLSFSPATTKTIFFLLLSDEF